MAINGIKCNKGNAEKLVAEYPLGSHIHLHAFRRDELMEFDVLLSEPVKDTCYLKTIEKTGKQQLQNKQAWLGH